MPSLDIAAGVGGSHAELKAKIGPALIVVALVVLAGVAFIMRHNMENNPRDTDWTDPHQPGQNVDLPLFLGPDGHDTPAGVGNAMRSRAYPPNLTDDHNSIIGRC